MMRRILYSFVLLVMVLLLAACKSVGGAKGDNTGQLGSPLNRESPADVYIDLSKVYLREGQLSDAFKNARKAVLVDSRSASAHNLLGVVYQRLGQNEEAGAQFRTAVDLEPRNPYALNALGSYLCGQRKFEDADTLFKRALNNPLYPTPWVAWHNAGLCAEEASQMDNAETYFRKALQVNSNFSPSLLRMAQISFDREKYLSARAYLQRFAQASKHTSASLWLGVRTEKQLGDRDQVASYMLKLKANFPDSEQVRYLDGAK